MSKFDEAQKLAETIPYMMTRKEKKRTALAVLELLRQALKGE